jgi:hypothetical protein
VPSFKDYTGQEWALRLTTGSVADVKAETGINLALASRETAWVEAVFGADGKLASILWVLCEAQAKERGLTPEQFAHLLDGETLSAAGDALGEAIALFTPRSAVAQAMRRGLAATFAATDKRLVAEIEKLIASTGSPSPTSAPASSASTPEG